MQATITDDAVIDDDVPDITPANDKPPSSEPQCEVCGIYIEWSHRGRRPKRCQDHRKNQSAGSGSGGRKTNVDGLVEGIEQFYMTIGMAIQFVPGCQNDGPIIAGNAAQCAHAWRPLLERDPKVRKMWEKMLSGTGWGGVIAAHAMMIYPIVQNHQARPKKEASNAR